MNVVSHMTDPHSHDPHSHDPHMTDNCSANTATLPRSAGLFHTAILFETQTALAAAVYSVATKEPGTFTGSADHLVSQAFYFSDPENNGVELYWDRAREK